MISTATVNRMIDKLDTDFIMGRDMLPIWLPDGYQSPAEAALMNLTAMHLRPNEAYELTPEQMQAWEEDLTYLYNIIGRLLTAIHSYNQQNEQQENEKGGNGS